MRNCLLFFGMGGYSFCLPRSRVGSALKKWAAVASRSSLIIDELYVLDWIHLLFRVSALCSIHTRAGVLWEMAKNSFWPVTGLGNKGPLKVLNGTRMILDDHGNNFDSLRISKESFRSFRGPLLHKTVAGQELFFVVSYSKLAPISWLM